MCSDVFYTIWDEESANFVADFETLPEVVGFVSLAQKQHGDDEIASLVVARERCSDATRLERLAKGAEILTLNDPCYGDAERK